MNYAFFSKSKAYPADFLLGEKHRHDLIVLVHVRLEIPAGEKLRDELCGTQVLRVPQSVKILFLDQVTCLLVKVVLVNLVLGRLTQLGCHGFHMLLLSPYVLGFGRLLLRFFNYLLLTGSK